MSIKIKNFTALIGAAVIGSGAFAQQSIVSWGGTGMVSTNQTLGGNGDLLDQVTSISPTSGYNGQTFYGGVIGTNAPVDSWFIGNDVSRGGAGMPAMDWISANAENTTDGAGTKFHRGVVFFQQSDFLAFSGDAGGVELQSMSVAVQRSSGNPSRFGFVIEADGGYFLSDPVTYNQFSGTGFNSNFTNGHWLNIADVTNATWLSFDPETSYSTIGAAGTPDLTKVTGVGVWFENERASDSTAGLGFHMTGIEITAIPEPSTLALLGIALGSVFIFRRRNR